MNQSLVPRNQNTQLYVTGVQPKEPNAPVEETIIRVKPEDDWLKYFFITQDREWLRKQSQALLTLIQTMYSNKPGLKPLPLEVINVFKEAIYKDDPDPVILRYWILASLNFIQPYQEKIKRYCPHQDFNHFLKVLSDRWSDLTDGRDVNQNEPDMIDPENDPYPKASRYEQKFKDIGSFVERMMIAYIFDDNK